MLGFVGGDLKLVTLSLIESDNIMSGKAIYQLKYLFIEYEKKPHNIDLAIILLCYVCLHLTFSVVRVVLLEKLFYSNY